MLKQIYTHLRSPLGLVAITVVTLGAISLTKYTPLKAQVSTNQTCDAEQCCWFIRNNACVNITYTSGGPFSPTYTQYCQSAVGEGTPWFETYNECSTGETTPQPVCGDGDIEGDEKCDDGVLNGTPGKCDTVCQSVSPLPPVCGNGKEEGDEQCDEGEENGVIPSSGDYCTIGCKKVTVQTEEEEEEEEDNNDDNNDTEDNESKSSASSRKSQSSASSVKTVTTPVQPEQKPTTTPNSDTILPSVPAVPQESEKTKEEKRKAEEEQKKAEEKRLADQQKILEDILQKSLDDAVQKDTEDKDTVLEDSAPKPEADVKKEPVVQQNVIKADELRCLDADGNSTTDRSKCDYKKEQEIQKPVVKNIPEEEVKVKIRENVLGSDIAQKRSDALLTTLRDLRARTATIANEEFNDEVEQYLQDVLDWLDRGIEYFSSEQRSLEDIERMTAPVRQLAEQTSVLIKQQKNLPLERPDINPILTKTETLLAKFRESFVALAQGQVALPQESLQAYVEAVNLYDTIKVLCTEDADECSRINEVLEKLKLVQAPLQKALDANPEIYKAVQAKFEDQ